MKIFMTAALSVSAILAVSAPAAATPVGEQFQARQDIVGGGGGAYHGRGEGDLGEVNDGGFDAFDGYGAYVAEVLADNGWPIWTDSPLGLTVTRRTELLGGNVYRFFDTFTNNIGQAISGTLLFYGEMGSDSATSVVHQQKGLSVSCQRDLDCYSDPIVAHVSGNNAMGAGNPWLPSRDDDFGRKDVYVAGFDVRNIGVGESVSLLNFAFLAREIDGTTENDVTLAMNTGLALLADPRLEGLNDAERARILNFTLTAPVAVGVPEPATWGLMLAGFGLVGSAMRTRRRAVRFAA